MKGKVNILSTTILSEGFFTLKNIQFEVEQSDGKVIEQKREVYQTSDGATVLLYNLEKRTVVLIRQFRITSHLNGNENGLMIEACAGIIEDHDHPEETVIREIEEETGYKVQHVHKIFELQSSPGATTERLHYYVAEYDSSKKINEGGGLDEEQEDIEVLELAFEDAFTMMINGTIADAKTVILLQYARQNIFPEEKVFNIL